MAAHHVGGNRSHAFERLPKMLMDSISLGKDGTQIRVFGRKASRPRTILPEDVTESTTGIKFPALLEDNSNRTALSSSGNSSGRRRSCPGEDGDLVQGAEDLTVAAAGGVVVQGGGRAVDDNDELGGRAASRRAPGAAGQRVTHAEQRRTSGIRGAERSRR